jgi:hypothetical protein
MSFNRNKYDNCAYELQMGRSRDPGAYRLNSDFAENCSQCVSTTGPVGSKADVSLSREKSDMTFKNLAETESQLSWRNQLLSKCNSNTDPFTNVKLEHKPTCSRQLTAEDTRFTFPIDNYRGMSLTSYMVSPYLPINPQCHIQDSCDQIGLNSRLSAKDTYKQPAAQAWDKGAALPKGK